MGSGPSPLLWLCGGLLTALLAMGAGLSSGCANEAAVLRKESNTQKLLQDTAKAYWHALRWNYMEKAVNFVESEQDKADLFEYLLDRKGKASMDDPTIYRVVRSEDHQDATVYISYELMLIVQAQLMQRRAKQHWYLKRGRWFLELAPEELTRLDEEPAPAR